MRSKEMRFIITTAEKVVATAVAYYRQADLLKPSRKELIYWLATCSAAEQAKMLPIKVEALMLIPAFKRYVLESRGCAMAAYMAARLSPKELLHWVDDGDGGLG
jgi:hypothetical protein